MNQEYSLHGDMLSTGGNGWESVVKSTVGAHSNIAFGLIIILAIVVVWLLYKKEGFMPTSTAKYQQVSLSGSEAMDNRGQSAFAQQVQSDFVSPSTWYAPAAQTMVMSDEANAYCADAGKPNNDAWSWMNTVAHGSDGNAASYSTDVYGNAPAAAEHMTGKKNLIAVMNGY